MNELDRAFSQLPEDGVLRSEFAGFLRRLAGVERKALEHYGPEQELGGGHRRAFLRGRQNALEGLALMVESGALTPELFFSDTICRLNEPTEDMPGVPPVR